MIREVVVGSYIVALVMDMDRLPVEGETVMGRNFHTTQGGKGSNMAAVAAARLGAETHFVGKIGRDAAHGQAFQDLLRQERVGADGVMICDTSPTATGIILFSAKGTNAIVIDKGANGELSPSDIEERFIAAGDIVISPLEISLEAARAAADQVNRKGGKAILNPAPAQDLRREDLSAFFAVTPNESEARVCLGLAPDDPIPDEVLADRLLDLGAPHVIITLGEQGVLWASRAGRWRIPALKVKAIDVVGAGDAFNAGLAVGLAHGRPLGEAICLGITAASLSTETRETIASYPARAEVDKRLPEVLAATERERA